MIGERAGCSNGSAENGNTGTGAASSSDAANNNNGAANQDQGVKFAECVRENGVNDFPDPNANGQFVYARVRGGRRS